MGTAITVFMGNWVFMNLYYHKRIKIDMIKYWKSIFSIFPSLLPNIIIGLILKRFLSKVSWGSLCLNIIIYAISYGIIIYLFGLNEKEKKLLIIKKGKIYETNN